MFSSRARYLLAFLLLLKAGVALYKQNRSFVLSSLPLASSMKDASGRIVSPYGEWSSPITSELMTSASVSLTDVSADPSGRVYWVESRPMEGGRKVLVRAPAGGGAAEDLVPPPFNVRTRVHEYGGLSYALVDGGAAVVFANFADQRLYRVDLGGAGDAAPVPLTEEGVRFGDMDVRGREAFAVMEDHRGDVSMEEGREPTNSVVAVSLDTGAVRTVAEGHSFYASPRVSPDGSRVAFVAWDHPCMPWDDTTLYVAPAAGGGAEAEAVAGRPGEEPEAVMQPRWSPYDGRLYFVTDRSGGWWSLHSHDGEHVREAAPRTGRETGGPAWQLGARSFDFLSAGRVLVAAGGGALSVLHTGSGETSRLDLGDFSGFSSVTVVPDGAAQGAETLAFIATSPVRPSAVLRYSMADQEWTELRRSLDVDFEALRGFFSVPEPVRFPSSLDGRPAHAHALLYRPASARHAAPAGELPPAIVRIHGGPTSAASTALAFRIQYWTSRGFAVLDVDYQGSTGYGRDYRLRLSKGRWGVTDVDDCAAGARYLAAEGVADPRRLAITGGSAGGYTALAAVARVDCPFTAAAAHYGVSDLEALAQTTHKFESRYLDRLVGPYPEARDVYVERSPITHVGRMRTPLALFQGLEDKIVPPAQSESIYRAVRARGVPVAYTAYEGEQHGFRQAANIRSAIDGEFSFYARVWGFTPADRGARLRIENLPAGRRIRFALLGAAAAAAAGVALYRWVGARGAGGAAAAAAATGKKSQ